MKLLQKTGIFMLIAMLAACQSYRDGSSRTIGEFTDDMSVQAAVKTRLMNDKEINGLNINVEVVKGVVSLYGRIQTPTLRKKAVDIATRVRGVSRVEDRLTLVAE